MYVDKLAKIVVSPTPHQPPNHFTVKVVQDKNVVISYEACGVDERDRLVWELCDTYNIEDVVIETGPEFKFSEIPNIQASNPIAVTKYFEDNPDLVFARIVQAVQEGVEAGRNEIRLFDINGTSHYITSLRPDWGKGLQKALEFYLDKELYEMCDRIKQLQARL